MSDTTCLVVVHIAECLGCRGRTSFLRIAGIYRHVESSQGQRHIDKCWLSRYKSHLEGGNIESPQECRGHQELRRILDKFQVRRVIQTRQQVRIGRLAGLGQLLGRRGISLGRINQDCDYNADQILDMLLRRGKLWPGSDGVHSFSKKKT